MSYNKSREILQGAGARLTRQALHELDLEDMRRRGEPTEGMKPFSRSDAAYQEYLAQLLAALEARVSTQDPLSKQETSSIQDSLSDYAGRGRAKEQSLRSTQPSQLIEGFGHIHENLKEDVCSSVPTKETCSQSSIPTRLGSEHSHLSPTSSALGPVLVDCPAPSERSEWWRHSVEFRLLRDEMLEAAKFRPGERQLYHTLDMNAFAADPSYDDTQAEKLTPVPAVPANFPPHRAINGVPELGAYLASSSYIVSLGGPPLADLKYGIIVVPAGEEALLFARISDETVMTEDFKEQVYAKSKAAQKEQEVEYQKQNVEERANKASPAPEFDDDDREFYRQRYFARICLKDDEEVTLLSRPAVRRRPEAHRDDDRMQVIQHESESRFKSAIVSVPESVSIRSKRSQVSDQRVVSNVLTEADTQMEHHRIHNCDGNDGTASGETPSSGATIPQTPRGSPSEESLRPEACRIPELVLRGERKRTGTRRLLMSLLSHTRLKNSPDPVVPRRSVLIEVAKAMMNLANGELCENPGIDARVWRVVQKGLALKATA
ncbi:hypothetical protein F5884DRAFT_859196 [Xylogone sp. PMI_703]|nr:hypothetical protein F5884DRAFT_859196 [Xylogone sp. PMI_703]